MLHEMTHLKWFAATSPKAEVYGCEARAKAVSEVRGNERKKVKWGTIETNADSLAWYAQYHYWNNMRFCTDAEG